MQLYFYIANNSSNRQELLHLAAKARITRMRKDKKKRKDLEMPPWAKELMNSKSLDDLANLLKQVNFDKD